MAEGIKQKCDFCDKPAVYDGKTVMGPWAFMCEEHFRHYGINCKGMYTELYTEKPKGYGLTKTCRICGKTLPITSFYQYTDNTGTLRYRNECKACNIAIRKK